MSDLCALNERAKELRCLYAVDAITSEREQLPAVIFMRVLQEIPAGWQRPSTTGARIEYLGRAYVGPGFAPRGKILLVPLPLWGVQVGEISVSDTAEAAFGEEKSFLPEEAELLRRIASRLGEYLEWKQTELLGERALPNRNHWAWRQRFAEALAKRIQPERFGVSRIFIGGSTARGDAGPRSDIDLFIVCRGSEDQKRALSAWLDGWSLCLGEVALQQTGEPFPEGILNVHWLDQEPGIYQRAELEELAL